MPQSGTLGIPVRPVGRLPDSRFARQGRALSRTASVHRLHCPMRSVDEEATERYGWMQEVDCGTGGQCSPGLLDHINRSGWTLRRSQRRMVRIVLRHPLRTI